NARVAGWDSLPRGRIPVFWAAAERNPKHQSPGSREVPNLKTPNPKIDVRADDAPVGFLNLVLLWRLEFGIWSLLPGLTASQKMVFEAKQNSIRGSRRVCGATASQDHFSSPSSSLRSAGVHGRLSSGGLSRNQIKLRNSASGICSRPSGMSDNSLVRMDGLPLTIAMSLRAMMCSVGPEAISFKRVGESSTMRPFRTRPSFNSTSVFSKPFP